MLKYILLSVDLSFCLSEHYLNLKVSNITWSKSKVLRPGLSHRNLPLCPRISSCALVLGLFVHCRSWSQSKGYRPRQRRAVSLCDTSALLGEHNFHISRPTAIKRGIQTFFQSLNCLFYTLFYLTRMLARSLQVLCLTLLIPWSTGVPQVGVLLL